MNSVEGHTLKVGDRVICPDGWQVTAASHEFPVIEVPKGMVGVVCHAATSFVRINWSAGKHPYYTEHQRGVGLKAFERIDS